MRAFLFLVILTCAAQTPPAAQHAHPAGPVNPHGAEAAAALAESDTLTGRLVNKTAEGGAPLANHPVLLQKHEWTSETDIRETGSTEAVTDAKGGFRFAGLSHHQHTFYTVSTDFQGVRYVSDPIFPMEPEKMKEMELAVYEVRDEMPPLEAHIHHMVLTAEKDGFLVQEMLLLRNGSRFSYKHDETHPPVFFSIPVPNRDFKAAEGLPEDAQPVDGKVEIHRAIRPGMLSMMYEYRVPRSGKIFLPVSFPTQIFSVILDGKDISISSPELGAAEETDIEGQKYLQLNGSSLEPGKSLTLVIHRRWSSEQIVLYGTLGAALALALTGFGATWWLRRRAMLSQSAPAGAAAEVPAAAPAPRPPVPLDEREAIMDAMAALDEAYEKGRVSPEEYTRKRAEMKHSLLRLLQGRMN